MEKKLLKAMFFLLTVNIIYGAPASQYVDITSVTGITPINTKSSGAGAMAIGPASEAHGPNSIAIGNGAKTEFFPEGKHEKIVAFGRTEDKLSGGIAIGNKTHARVGTIDIGHRDITGAIGDWNAQGSKSDLLDRISTTTVGDNSINRGNFSSIFGAYNIISKRPRVNGKGFLGLISNSTAATQGLGSVITGTLNSIEGNEQNLNYAGLASIVSGTANKISKSNGVAIIGVGNEVSNSYLTPNSEKLFNAFLTGGGSSNIKEFADTFREFSNEVELGSVGITGGANKVDFALFSNITGVGNKLIGSGARLNLTLNSNNTQAASDKFSTFNNILGYKNTLEDVNHLILIGSSNNVTTSTSNLVFGNNHILKGTADAKAEGNIVLGFNTTKEESNFKVSGKNIVAVGNDIVATEDNSVYLGNGSKNATAGASKVMEEYNTDTINGITLNFAGGTPAGIVSVGSEGKERRIQNVAAGWISATSTDAINGSQLHSVINNMTTKIEALATPNVVVKGNGPITVTSVEENKEKVFTVGVTLGEITSTTGGRASTANEAGLVTSGSVVAAVNALGSNTIKLEGDSGKTDGQNLNKENGLTFGIKGSGLVKTEAKGTDVIIDLSDEVKEKLNNVETSTSSANSGVASAVAMANLPQVSNTAGHRHNIAGAYGYYNGEHAFALGLSGLNETGNLVYKASGSLNTKGHVALGAGLGYQFDVKTSTINRKDEIEELRNENKKNKELIQQLFEKISELEKNNK